MKKILSLLALLMVVLSSAWAETEKSGNTGANNTTWTGISMSLDGKYIAGGGGVKQGNMPDKGVKLRSNQGNLVFAVNAGFKVTGFKFYSAGNTATSVDIESATVDGGSNLLPETITIPGKGESTSADVILTGIEARENVTLTFASGSSAQIVGTWEIEYVQEEVVVQEINAVSLNGTAISTGDLTTLKSEKSLTIDGSGLNGLGALDVTLSSGATTVTRTITDSDAAYTFTINGSDEYTVNVTSVAKTYDAEAGSVVYYSKDGDKVEGANEKAVTANGITFAMADESKTFQDGSGSVTLGDVKYVPLKLSTGSAVNVTFPEGKVATKAIVYGWSANGNGKLTSIKESAESEKSVDSSNDIFYATNNANDIYPSVYEYDLDDWKSFYFSAGGSASQPFVVIDFVLEDDAPATSADVTFDAALTDGSKYYATFYADHALDFTEVEGVKAYIVPDYKYDSKNWAFYANTQEVEKVPANTGVLLVGDEAKTYTIPFTDEAVELETTNKFLVVTEDTKAGNLQNPYTLIYDKYNAMVAFREQSASITIPACTVYLPLTDDENYDAYGYVIPKFGSDEPEGPASAVANIGELKAVTEAGNYEVTLTNAVVTYSGADNFVLEDATGALNIEVEGIGMYGLAAGSLLNGTLTFAADVADYTSWGMGIVKEFELTEDSQQGLALALFGMGTTVAITEGEAPQPLAINDETDFGDLLTWAADPEWRYVKFTDATVKLEDTGYGYNDVLVSVSGNDYYIQDKWSILTEDELDALQEGDEVEVVGFVYEYLGATCFQPISLTVKSAEPATVAVNVGTDGYATFSSDKALDFTESAIKAYVATVSGKTITFTRVQQVPAGTGVLLYAEGGASEEVPVVETAAAVTNAFVVAAADMDGAALTAAGAYILGSGASGICFYKAASTATLAAGKAYLTAGVAAGARIILPGETTGISSAVAADADAPVYNLNGQRLEKAGKGLYIVGGKKVILK